MAAADYYPLVQELYISYFGRPADPRGLANFAGQLDALNAPTDSAALELALKSDTALSNLVNSFSSSDESKALYSKGDTLSFVGQIYKNVLNRVGDADGMLWWANEIDAGHVTRANAALAIMNGALENTTDQGVKDAALVQAKVAVAGSFTAAIDTGDELLAYVGNDAAATARNMLQTVTSTTTTTGFQTTIDATLNTLVHGSTIGQSYDLKETVDTLTGTGGDDTFNAVLGDNSTTAKTSTLTGLDNLNGGLGNDILNIADVSGSATMPGGITLTSIETVNLSSVGAVGTGKASFDLSGQSGVTTFNIATSTGADNIKAGSGQAVTVNDTAGTVTLAGGASQTVNTAGGVVLTKSAGAINVTDTAQGAVDSSVDGGTSVNVTTTVDQSVGHGKLSIGTGASPSGAVNVTANLVGDTAGDQTAGAITIKGGSTVTVTENGTQDLAADGTAKTLTQAAVTVHGSAATTAVTVNQAMAAAATDAIDATATVVESSSVKFGAMKTGDTITVDGLTFTAAKALTAAQAAAAFANLAATSTQGMAPTANGTYSGTFGGHWTSGAVATDTVVFSDTQGGNVADLTVNFVGTGTAPVATKVADGVTGADAQDGVGGINAGQVLIDDKAYGTGTNTIATVTLNSYGDASKIQSDALTKLSLANVDATSVLVDNHTATALDLTLNTVTGGSAVNLDDAAATYTTLAVHTTGDDSAVNLTASKVTALTIDGSNALDLTGSTLSALKSVTVSGSAGVSMALDASKASFTGGSGSDIVTLSSTTVKSAVSTGAGNDTVVLASGTTALSAKIDGGDGTDILKMDAADAAAATANSTFAGNVANFEKLSLGASTAANTVDLANMNNISYVISANSTGGIAVAAPTALAPATTQGVNGTSTEHSDVAFNALVAGQSYTVAGRTVTATGAATAAEVAAAFDTGVAGGAAVVVSGTLAGWSATAIAGSTVTFTSSTANTNVTDITTSASGSSANSLTLANMANAGTLELNAAGNGVTVNMKDASGTADSFNIVTKLSTANTNYGTVNVAGVETVNLTVTDTKTSTGIQTATIALKDAAAKALVITGNAHLSLTLDASDTALASIDGTAATGKLTIATLAGASAATTVKGGAGADSLTANHISDVLNGGAGNDTLVVNADLVSLTGGTGADKFDVSHATTNVNAYATIADLGTGDTLLFANGATFNASKVALGDTAVFQDYANAAINQSAANAITWFQFGGNTYVVDNVSHGSTFANGTDVIVKITGAVDLSTASFNSTSHTLVVA